MFFPSLATKLRDNESAPAKIAKTKMSQEEFSWYMRTYLFNFWRLLV